MTGRMALIDGFLAGSNWAGWTRAPMGNDASARQYLRLVGPDRGSAIVMDAPPEAGEDVRPFLGIARHLTATGLCAPRILLADADRGLLLIEDLGPLTVAQWLQDRPRDAHAVYAATVDALLRIQRAPPPAGLVALTPAHAARMIAPLREWYAPSLSPETLAAMQDALHAALNAYAPQADVLSLRDFHAENLIWRPDRQGTDRIGLLDFQDAVLAPPEYDLASFLRDARRDVDADLRAEITVRFARRIGVSVPDCAAATACLGVQRNLRILGIFAALARRDGKMRYLALMPRIWRQIEQDLTHPALAGLRPLVLRHLPAPGPAFLKGFCIA